MVHQSNFNLTFGVKCKFILVEELIVVRMAKHRRKLRISSWMLPYLIIILIFSVFVGAAAFYRPAQTPEVNPPAQAKDYFQTVNATTDSYDVKTFRDSNGTILKLYSLMFSIKPVGGPAHEVTVSGFSDADPVDATPFNLTQGQSGFIQLRATSSYPVQAELEEGKGFPFMMYVSSIEAEGEITVYLTLQ